MLKAFSKRIKITKNKKMVYRKSGQNHFRAKKSGNTIRAKRKNYNVGSVNKKQVNIYQSGRCHSHN